MRAIMQLFVAAAILLVTSVASAQTRVYETREADGSPVFSDVPASDSEAVDIPATNIAEPPVAGNDSRDQHDPDRAGHAGEDMGPKITVIDNAGPRAHTGDGFVEEQTPEGSILVNKRERDKLDQDEVIYRGSHRIMIEEPRPHAGKDHTRKDHTRKE